MLFPAGFVDFLLLLFYFGKEPEHSHVAPVLTDFCCRIRMGLILEDVDGFAGDIAHRHAADDSSRNVTASVDKITWLQSPPEGRTR
jgi:hypothetical protein